MKLLSLHLRGLLKPMRYAKCHKYATANNLVSRLFLLTMLSCPLQSYLDSRMKLTSNEFMDGGPKTDKYAGKNKLYALIRIFKCREFTSVMYKYAFLIFLGMKISLSLKSTLRRWLIRASNPRKLTRSVDLIHVSFKKVFVFSCICWSMENMQDCNNKIKHYNVLYKQFAQFWWELDIKVLKVL